MHRAAVQQTELEDIRSLNARVDAMQARLLSNIEQAKQVLHSDCVSFPSPLPSQEVRESTGGTAESKIDGDWPMAIGW